jgi:hypothetical protein
MKICGSAAIHGRVIRLSMDEASFSSTGPKRPNHIMRARGAEAPLFHLVQQVNQCAIQL